jgi:hypothetical protein
MTEYKDLRSASAETKRHRTRRAKYLNFATANEGQLTTPHYVVKYPGYCYRSWQIYEPAFRDPALLDVNPDNVKLVPGLSKRDVYELAQDARYYKHGKPAGDRKRPREMDIKRGTLAAKRLARDWQENWFDEELLAGYDLYDRECEYLRDWEDNYWQDEMPVEPHRFDIAPLVSRAEEQWKVGEKRVMERLGWVDAWDDENWQSDGEDAWSDVDCDELSL